MTSVQLRLLNELSFEARPSQPEADLLKRVSRPSLAAALLSRGAIDANTLIAARTCAQQHALTAEQVLLRSGQICPETLCRAQAACTGAQAIDLQTYTPDRRLIETLGPAQCLKLSALPVRRFGGKVLIATHRPETLPQIRAALPPEFGEPLLALCSEPDLNATLTRIQGHAMAAKAETRVAEPDSCRYWYSLMPRLIVGAGVMLLALALMAAPSTTVTLLTLLALIAMFATVFVRAAALIAQLRTPSTSSTQPPPSAPLPTVSVMVPLLREENIALRLIWRLERLDYPRELLDICLVTEASDKVTQRTLASTNLPSWMRVITVPDGRLKTKPRALNYALDFCRGEIIGIYDAEDAPDPDQILKVVSHFQTAPPQVACLQGKLDFYNSAQNWLSRCFTIDYAGWFRVLLPGIAQLGLVVPLGGTTLFLRRDVIEQVGGWDAHNVTEDADLGIRLARRGYRTELIDTVTNEEANCHIVPWIKQRSRWIKGFAMTYSVHMRRPRQLWRELGPWRFAGFQAMFLGSLLQATLMPVIWSFWLLPLGFDHPLGWTLHSPVAWGLVSLFAIAEAVHLVCNAIALRMAGKGRLWPWLPMMHLYHPLATVAAYKALAEMVITPFYWDKTHHGIAPQHHHDKA